jgi:tetratricopeptide (TPR) repeat protein
LAAMGERGAALVQYEACRRVLRAELGAPPSPETEQMYQQMLEGSWPRPAQRSLALSESPYQPPSFLNENPPIRVERPVFVARERALAWLERHLDRALTGQGGVAFVIGGPGRGKTALLQTFSRKAMQAHPDLLVAGGSGNAYSGVGDPLLPFRSVLEMLSGDVEAQWAAGAIDRGQALQLWQTGPLTARALTELGPDLIDTFLPGRGLVDRVAACQAAEDTIPAWFVRFKELVSRKASLPPDPNLQQSALFRQYTRVLGSIGRHHSLLVLLDDLQWIDAASTSLLFHLGHELAGKRILIVGAYRPEEVILSRPQLVEGRQQRHPLDGVLDEFKRRYGDIWLDLSRVDQKEGRHFVEALLDSEPNRLGKGFREALFHRTEGHPLFTTELLQALKARGDLIREGGADGAWVAGPALDWDALPPKVEGVIAERVNRLDHDLRALMTVASVEGETFTAQVVARVQGIDERDVIRHLSSVLERRHRLVRAQGLRRLDGLSLSLHRFQHNLFQKYLYDSLNEAERAYLHQDVGNALEELYAEHPHELAAIAPQLAHHFQEAGDTAKAVQYLAQAGQRAARLSANHEAVAHFYRALKLLDTLPDTAERAQTELNLQLSLAVSLVPTKGWGASEMARVVGRAQALCESLGKTPQHFGTLWFSSNYRMMRGDHPGALELAHQYRDLAEGLGDEGLIVVAYYGLTSLSFFLGEFAASVAYGDRVRNLYDPVRHHIMTYLVVGHDPAAQALEAAGQALWMLGYPDQARQRVGEAVALAEGLAHPHTTASAYAVDGVVASLCRDWPIMRERAERALDISQEHGNPVMEAFSRCEWGVALARHGKVEQGIAQLQRGLSAWQATDMLGYGSQLCAWLVEAYLLGGRTRDGLKTVDETLDFVAKSQECMWEAELHRLKGELLLVKLEDEGEDKVAAEAEMEREYWLALKIARRQNAKSWELRATMSLARLWQRQGKQKQAHGVLAEITGWFTEGFDTGDLMEASALLDELSGA